MFFCGAYTVDDLRKMRVFSNRRVATRVNRKFLIKVKHEVKS
jgi:acyl-CoA thioesterase